MLISLIAPFQATDDSLRTNSFQSVAGQAKVYYRDHEVILVEARDGALEISRRYWSGFLGAKRPAATS